MSTMAKGIRKPIYLSEAKDHDILSYINPLLSHHNFSSVIRDLVRDGMKFREGKQPRQSVPVQEPQEVHSKVLQSVTSPVLDDIVLADKEVTKEDLESRLDDF